jgi:hypothetical protein
MMIVDYSEAFLQLDKNLRSVYELMLKGHRDEAAQLLEEISRIATYASNWIKDDNNQ